MDCVTYSYRGHAVGVRVLLFARELIPAWQLPIHMALGFSRQFVDGTPVGGWDLAGGTGESYSDEVTYVEVGGGLSFSVSDITRVRCEVSRYTTREDFDRPNFEQSRWAFKAGIDLRFR
jgi:hypothetical protein